jgi:hypothetical protein
MGKAPHEVRLAFRRHKLGPVPRRRASNAFRTGELRRVILAGLRPGPQPLKDNGLHVASRKPDVPCGLAHVRASCVAGAHETGGLVEHERPVWRVATQQTRSRQRVG